VLGSGEEKKRDRAHQWRKLLHGGRRIPKREKLRERPEIIENEELA